jgi:hypothetical protein
MSQTVLVLAVTKRSIVQQAIASPLGWVSPLSSAVAAACYVEETEGTIVAPHRPQAFRPPLACKSMVKLDLEMRNSSG